MQLQFFLMMDHHLGTLASTGRGLSEVSDSIWVT